MEEIYALAKSDFIQHHLIVARSTECTLNFIQELTLQPIGEPTQNPVCSRVFGRGKDGTTVPHMSSAAAHTRQKLLVIHQNLYLLCFWVLGWTFLFALQFGSPVIVLLTKINVRNVRNK